MSRRVYIGLFQVAALLVLSGSLHAALLGTIPSDPDALAFARADNPPSRVEFETIEPPPPPPPPEPEPERPPPPDERPAPPPLPREAKRKQARPPPVSVTAPAVEEPPPPEAPEPAPEPAQPEPQKPRILDLSARSAALSVWVPSAPAPSGRATRSVAEIEQAASLALNQQLKPALRDDGIDVKCDASDRCVYKGKAIDATIQPDGTVEYKDKALKGSQQYGVKPPPAVPTAFEDLRAPQQLQLSTRIEGRAVESERQRFLDQTEGLRRERIDAWARKVEQDGSRSFRTRLDQVWKDPSQTAESKRRLLFDVWEETSPDELGARYRKLVLDYVRRNLPENGGSAYSADELARLNAHRQQHEPFAPYTAP